MKQRDRKLICLLAFCAAIWVGGCEIWPQFGPPPNIKFEKLEHDFGEIPPNSLKKVKIKFTNTGEGSLRIKKVEECCGVDAKLAGGKKKYAPGESGALEVAFTSGPKAEAFSRELIVHTNDRENRRVKLGLKAQIVLSITWEPVRLKLYPGRDNAGCPKITIGCLKKQAFSITEFKSTGDCITADFDPMIKATEFVLEPKVDMEKLGENVKGKIRIGVTHTDGNAAEIPFDVVPRFTVDPQVVMLIAPESGKPVVKSVKVINHYDEDFEIESVSAISENMSVKVLEQRKTETGYQLDVELIPQLTEDKGLFMGEFSVKIKGAMELTVPCRGWYSKKN